MTTNIGADVATSVNIGFNKDENKSKENKNSKKIRWKKLF